MALSPHGFYVGRARPAIERGDLGEDDQATTLAEYANLPRTIGAVVSLRLATLHETQTVYSLRDVYDLLEIGQVDAYNRWLTRPKVK